MTITKRGPGRPKVVTTTDIVTPTTAKKIHWKKREKLANTESYESLKTSNAKLRTLINTILQTI